MWFDNWHLTFNPNCKFFVTFLYMYLNQSSIKYVAIAASDEP